MPSSSLKKLQKQLARLRKDLLPDPFSALGKYPASIHTSTRAYVLLAHAEIENYLEDWARTIAKASEQMWTTKHRICRPLAILLATSKIQRTLPPPTTRSAVMDPTSEVITKVLSEYRDLIKSNHGIKEQNAWAMFFPIGLPQSALPTVLAGQLDSLGSRRGTHAHTSASKVLTPLDPQTEYDNTQLLLGELVALDDALAALLKAAR